MARPSADRILELLQGVDMMTAWEIADALGTNLSTTKWALAGLHKTGYVHVAERERSTRIHHWAYGPGDGSTPAPRPLKKDPIAPSVIRRKGVAAEIPVKQWWEV